MKSYKRKLLSTVTQLALGGCFLMAGAPALMAQEADDDYMLEEVLVTARKMSENIQEIPVAITAIGADAIQNLGIRDLADISKITAGLTFESEFGRNANRPVIRGQANILGSSGVSYFIDGVYISSSIDDYDINDIERIEIVKGPQSALYGRNTYSGAINIVTRSPSDEMDSRVAVKLAEDDEYEVSATLKGRMTENLKGGITGRYYERGGPFTNTFDGTDIGEEESSSVSGVLYYTRDKWDIRFRAYLGRTEDGQPALMATDPADNNCYFDQGSLYNGRGRYYCGVIEPGPINSDWRLQAPGANSKANTLQSSLVINYEINDTWDFTSITGYNDRDESILQEADYGPDRFQTAVFASFPFTGFEDGPPWGYGYVGSMVDFTFASETSIKDFSQELRFAFDTDRFSGLIGGYYFDQDDVNADNRVLPPGAQETGDASWFARFLEQQGNCAANPFCEFMVPFFGSTIVPSRDVNSLNIRNVAAFGMLAWHINDAWTLTAEGRWAEERIKQNARVQDLGDPSFETVYSEETYDSFNPRLTLDWRFSDSSMMYLLYAEGNKPGGFNGTVAIEAGVPTYDEETVDSVEFGNKNTLAGGQVMLNWAAYFNQIEGYQLTQNVRSGGNTTSAIDNVGDADVYGAEVEFMWRPAALEGFTLTANYAYNKSEFTRGTDQNQGVLEDVADDGLVNCSTGDEFPEVDGCTSKYGSIVDHRLPRSPKHQAYIDLDFRRPFGSGNWDWFIGGNYFYDSSKYAQVHNLAETGSTTLVNARLGMANDNWTIQVFGRNLTGEDSAPALLRYASGDDDFQRNFALSQRRDTYWGAQVIWNY